VTADLISVDTMQASNHIKLNGGLSGRPQYRFIIRDHMFAIIKLQLDYFLSAVVSTSINNQVLSPKRLGQLVQAFFRFAETNLYVRFPGLSTLIPELLLEIEQSFLVDPNSTVRKLLALKIWTINFLKTGLMQPFNLPAEMWKGDLGGPVLIGRFIAFIMSISSIEHRALLFSVLMNILQIGELSSEIITAKAVKTLANGSAPTDHASAEFFTKIMGVMGLSTASMFEALTALYLSSFGLLVRGIGPNGVLGWSAIADARSLKTSGVYQDVLNFITLIKGDKILASINAAAILPLVSLRNFSNHLFKLQVISRIESGPAVIVGVNYWIILILYPFSTFFNTMFSTKAGYLGEDQRIFNLKAKEIASNKDLPLLSFSVSDISSFPVTILRNFLNCFFGSNVGDHLFKFLQPTTIGGINPDSDLLVSDMLFRNLKAFRSIMVATIVFIIDGVGLSTGNDTKGTYYFNASGDFLIIDSKIIELVLAQFRKFGIILGELSSQASTDQVKVLSFDGNVYVDGHNITGIPAMLFSSMFSNNSLAFIVQNFGSASKWFTTPELFWAFITPLLNQTDSRLLLVLNSLPSSVSGIVVPMLGSAYVGLANGAWYKAVSATDDDINQLYVYIVVSELLSRLDSMLRLSRSMSQYTIMQAQKLNCNNYTDEDGISYPISSVLGRIIGTVLHPISVAIDSIVTSSLTLCFSIVSSSAGNLPGLVQRARELMVLISAISSATTDFSEPLLSRHFAAKINILLVKAINGGLFIPLVHTTKLPGYGHPFVVTFQIGKGTTIQAGNYVADHQVPSTSDVEVKAPSKLNPYA
jgi:hypothetical protein